MLYDDRLTGYIIHSDTFCLFLQASTIVCTRCYSRSANDCSATSFLKTTSGKRRRSNNNKKRKLSTNDSHKVKIALLRAVSVFPPPCCTTSTDAFLDVRRSLSGPALRTHTATRTLPEGRRAHHSHRSQFRYVFFVFFTVIYFPKYIIDRAIFLSAVKLVKRYVRASIVACLQPPDLTQRCFLWLPYPWALQWATLRTPTPHFVSNMITNTKVGLIFFIADLSNRQNVLIPIQPPACNSRPADLMQSRLLHVS